MNDIKRQITVVFNEQIAKRKAMFLPFACVSAFMLVGYAAADKESPEIQTNRIVVSYGDDIDVDVIDVTDNRASRENITVTADDTSFDNEQLGTYPVEVTAIDQFSNETKKTIQVEVVDQQGPEFKVLGANDGYFVQVPYNGSEDVTSYIQAIDNVDGDVTAFIEADQNLDTADLGIQDITLSVADSAGNKTVKTFIFTVADLEAPTIEVASDVVVDYASTFDINNYTTITDNMDETVNVEIEGTVDTKKEEKQDVTITAKDSAGNVAETTITFEVKDISAPEISLSTDKVKLEKNANFDAKSYVVSAIDNKDGDVTDKVQASSINTSDSGTKTVTYTATDAAGNTSTATLEVVIEGEGNQAIADAALAQVGVAQDCTMLVTNALKAVGIYHHGWPASYMSLGHVVSYSEALPGDIIYYANGGTGVAHVAIYIGNGQAVHGGWKGNTVVYSANYSNCSTPIFIRVDR